MYVLLFTISSPLKHIKSKENKEIQYDYQNHCLLVHYVSLTFVS